MQTTQEVISLQEAQTMINNWLTIRKSSSNKVKKVLAKNAFFLITKEDWNNWMTQPEKPETLYAYIGVDEKDGKGSTVFILSDRPLNSNTKEDAHLVACYFEENKKGWNWKFLNYDKKGADVTPAQAKERMKVWQTDYNKWLNDKSEETQDEKSGLPIYFSVSFERISVNFNKKAQCIYAFPGLKEPSSEAFKTSTEKATTQDHRLMDFLLWGALDKEKNEAVDKLESPASGSFSTTLSSSSFLNLSHEPDPNENNSSDSTVEDSVLASPPAEG